MTARLVVRSECTASNGARPRNGQTSGAHGFSVAQHSLLVERILLLKNGGASSRDRLATLLHDAPEYVIGDLISPFKAVIDDAYRAVEERLHAEDLQPVA